jgi:hypothetical protein
MAAAGGGAAAASSASWLPWLIGGGSALIGGLGSIMGGQAGAASSDTSREANRRSVELGRNQSLINSQMMSPFVGSGMGALYDLYGYSQVPAGYGGVPGSSGGNAFTVPTLELTGSKWDSPTTVGGVTYAKTGNAFDPTGGSGKYMQGLENYATNFQGYDPGQYIGKLEGYNQNFKFDENDPAYQYQKQIAERDINRQAAARGLFGSRAALNQLDESGRALTASEYDKQYNRGYQNLQDLYGMAGTEDERLYGRGYTNLVDLYNMASKQGQTGYNALLDAVKIGTGSGASAGGLGNQAVANVNSAYNSMANTANMNAMNTQNMIGGVAGSAAGGLNNAMLYNLLMGNKTGTTTPNYADPYGH